MTISPLKILLLSSACVLTAMGTRAQDTTGKKRTINITSSFKPVLREGVKINFNAALPVSDSARPVLQYSIPKQNLLTGFLPQPLQPVALAIDSVNPWVSSNYIKAGAGNVHLPYVQAGFSFGDGKTGYYNVFAKGYASKGNYNDFQKNNYTGVSASAAIKTTSGLEWNGKLGFTAEDYFFYGYQPASLVFTRDQLRQRFQSYDGQIGLRNLAPTEFGLSYNPNLKVNVFDEKNFFTGTTHETNSVLNLPLNKTLGGNYSFDLVLTADLTHYNTQAVTQNNNVFYVSPSVKVNTANFNLTAGLTPSWNNNLFHLFPNIMADIVTNDKNFTLQVGWIGNYDKGSYQRYTQINPWLLPPGNLRNTRAQEMYAGIKGSLIDHFSYSAKIGFVQYRDMPLFINDSTDGKTFNTVYASSLQALKVHGEIAWTQGEDITWTNALTLTHYSNIAGQIAPWGLVPLEITSSLRWQLFKDFFLNAGLYGYGGAPYQARVSPTTYKQQTGQSGIDVNAGVEFKVARPLKLWLQFNNIFNNKYERWHQYQVYGFNLLGGIIFSFDQK